MQVRWFSQSWGESLVRWLPVKRRYWLDFIILLVGLGLLYLFVQTGRLWSAPKRDAIAIDLGIAALPRYTLFSLIRASLAYFISLAFTLLVAPIAARSPAAERILVPFIDICQSIPVLGFMPGLVLALYGISSGHNVGLELAAILMIFTSQAWNMAFSVYYSIKALPADLSLAADHFGWDRWQRFKWLELPASANGLVWNSMMSMAGAWFFLMVNEAFRLGERDFRLPGIGAYMSEAVARGDGRAQAAALVAMLLLIVLLDQLVWRPVLIWSLRFRLDDGRGALDEESSTWALDLVRHSRLVRWLRHKWAQRRPAVRREIKRRIVEPARAAVAADRPAARLLYGGIAAGALLIGCVWASLKLFNLLAALPGGDWLSLGLRGLATLARVLAATALATLWTLPVGLWIGLSPRLSRLLQPVVQLVAAFPAPMLFALTVQGLLAIGLGLSGGSILLMLLGGQWYLLFNVIAGAGAIPADLREAGRSFRLNRWGMMRKVYLPGVFPYLVTGWVTCAGGSWNASIITEFFTLGGGRTLSTYGLGSAISEAAGEANFPKLACAVLLMVVIVIVFNRLVWRPLYDLAEKKYALSAA